MAENCVFCKIIGGEIPSKKVYEDEKFIAILDIAPAAAGHILLLPKAHSDSLLDADAATLAAAPPLLARLANAVKAAFGADGVNIVQNNGAAAGQTVNHLHFHVIPRKNGDNLNILWKPTSPSAEELAEAAEKLAKSLA
jgi:histidine triad (HIT) family protein